MAALAEYRRMPKEKRKRYHNALCSELDREWLPFETHCQRIAEQLAPTKSQFLGEQPNIPDISNQEIIDNSAALASRTHRDGMCAAVTPKPKPWFKLLTKFPRLNKIDRVKEWLEASTEVLRGIVLGSNFHDVIPDVYQSAADYSNAPLSMEEDDETVVLFQSFPIGSYRWANDYKGRVRVFKRTYPQTVRQIVQKFGVWSGGELQSDNLSESVMDRVREDDWQSWLNVTHLIYPNENYDRSSIYSRHKRYASCHFESGMASFGGDYLRSYPMDQDKYLAELGFDYFPLYGLRYGVIGAASYGCGGPGSYILGDSRQVQKMESKSLKALDREVDPVLNAPLSMRARGVNNNQGGVNWVAGPPGASGVQSAYQVAFDYRRIETKIDRKIARIDEAYLKKAFISLLYDERMQRATAEEIRAADMEKYVVVGPFGERIETSTLTPMIADLFIIAWNRGLIERPPPEIENAPLSVEYTSIAAQAQRMAARAGDRQFLFEIAKLKEGFPAMEDKINVDESVEVLAEALGASARVVNDPEQTAAIRQAKMRALHAEQAQMRMTALRQGASAMKDLSQANLDTDSVLSRVNQEAELESEQEVGAQ